MLLKTLTGSLTWRRLQRLDDLLVDKRCHAHKTARVEHIRRLLCEPQEPLRRCTGQTKAWHTSVKSSPIHKHQDKSLQILSAGPLRRRRVHFQPAEEGAAAGRIAPARSGMWIDYGGVRSYAPLMDDVHVARSASPAWADFQSTCDATIRRLAFGPIVRPLTIGVELFRPYSPSCVVRGPSPDR